MRTGYNKGFKKNKYSVRRTSAVENTESTAALQIVRVVVLLLMLAVIITTITIGAKSVKTGAALEKSTAYKSETVDNELLLKVVNASNPLDESFVPDLCEQDGYSVNLLAEKPLNELLAAAEKDGVNLSVERAYTSFSEQDKLYKKTYNKYRRSEGLTQVKAQAKTEATVPKAGRSEYQTGLLIRFKTDENKSFKDSSASAWLERNASDFGFILRYPEGKTAQTSMSADYAAYRYVGEDNARVMRILAKTFNEYSYYIASR